MKTMLPGAGAKPAAVSSAQMRAAMQDDPARFNREAILNRLVFATQNYSASGIVTVDLPSVGYLKSVRIYHDLDFTSVVGVAGRFKSGALGATSARYPAPWSVIKRIRMTTSGSGFIYDSSGYGNYLWQLIGSKTMDPWTMAFSSGWGRARAERLGTVIFNVTDGTVITPDTALAASKNYKLRTGLHLDFGLTEAAVAGLLPVQDQRQNPQITIEFGAVADYLSVAADAAATPTGTATIEVENFKVPDISVRPDTNYQLQHVQAQTQIAGAGDIDYKPQLGGIVTNIVQQFWNNDRLFEPANFDRHKLTIQQNETIYELTPVSNIQRQRRLLQKGLPDSAIWWPFSAGSGLVELASFRDSLRTGNLTNVTLRNTITAGTTITAPADVDHLVQQLLPINAG